MAELMSSTDASMLTMQRLFSGRPIRTMFDIGANEGRFTQEALDALAPARIYAFEPIKQHYEALCRRWPTGEPVSPVCMAMTNSAGPIELHINSNPAYNHSLLPRDPASDGWAKVEHVAIEIVQGGTVDDFCHQHAIDHLEILKVDAEGADFLVLQGAEKMLRQKAIDLVYVEVLLKPLFAGQGGLRQFLDMMEGYGYVFFNLFDVRTNSLGQLTLANAMFVAPDLLAASDAAT